LQGLRDFLATDAQRPRPILIDGDADALDLIVPVEVDAFQILSRRHHFGHFGRHLTQLFHVASHHPKLHRIADRRPEVDAHHARADMGPASIRRIELILQLLLQCLPFGRALGGNQQLTEIGVWQLLLHVHGEVRHASADIGRINFNIRIIRQQFLDALDFFLGGIE
jgi:hypothetical protein